MSHLTHRTYCLKRQSRGPERVEEFAKIQSFRIEGPVGRPGCLPFNLLQSPGGGDGTSSWLHEDTWNGLMCSGRDHFQLPDGTVAVRSVRRAVNAPVPGGHGVAFLLIPVVIRSLEKPGVFRARPLLVLVQPMRRPSGRQVRIPVCKAGGGTLPGVNLSDSADLLDRMEQRR